MGCRRARVPLAPVAGPAKPLADARPRQAAPASHRWQGEGRPARVPELGARPAAEPDTITPLRAWAL